MTDTEKCRCGASGVDASGRCIDCVNRDFNRTAMEQRDKRSVWKLRDIEQAKASAESIRKAGK